MSDNRGRDGGFRSAGRKDARPSVRGGEKRAYKPRGEKPAFGEKKGYAPRGEKPAFDGKKGYAPRGEKPAFGEKKSYAPRGEKPAFGEKKSFAPRGEKPAFDGKKGYAPRGGHAPSVKHAPTLAPRRVALETLLDVSRSDAYASLALDKRLAQAAFWPRDRAFVTQLVYGTLENRLTLDWRIDQFLEGEKELDLTVREILRMGA